MLVLYLWLESLADVHVVELLAVHVEEVCVSLELRDVRSLIKIPQIRHISEVLERLDKGELVEVTSDDDLCVLILIKDVGNKFLCTISVELYMKSTQGDLQQSVASVLGGHQRHH
jgi:Holliday junction resolvasome RuvABC DNA-binding subunit